MGNKKRRTTERLNESHHCNAPVELPSSEMSMVETNNLSVDLVEIKVEPGIKEELQSVGELVDVPIYRSMGSSVPPLDVNQLNGEFDFADINSRDIKTESKVEVDKKKGNQFMTDAHLDKDGVESQHNHQLPTQGEDDFLLPEVGHGTNSKSLGNTDDPMNVSKKHKCGACEYSTQHKGHLNRHMLKHTGEKSHGCKLCSKRFTSMQNLRGHMKVHVEEYLFSCSVCLQGFDVKEEKVAHEMNCNTRRYECYLCKESFGSQKQNMMLHMRMHSGDKPFQCTECFKKFTQKSVLIKHMKLLHAAPRSFRCSKCHQGFPWQDEKNVHEEKCSRQVYKCDICSKSFGLKMSHLIRHMRTHTGEKPFQCEECPKKFTQNSYLKLHVKTHTKKLQFKFCCLICRQRFPKDSKRKAHQRNCRGRYYECHLCNKFFGLNKVHLQNHMRIHSGERPFQCELCQNRFTEKGGLKKHMNRIHNKNY